MDDETRRELSISVSVAMKTERQSTKRKLVSKSTIESDDATHAIAERVVQSIERSFEVNKKPWDASGWFSTSRGFADKPQGNDK